MFIVQQCRIYSTLFVFAPVFTESDGMAKIFLLYLNVLKGFAAKNTERCRR